MKKYKTLATDKQTKEHIVFERFAKSKAEFIKELRYNGYRVTDYKVKTAEVYDWIVDNTNCEIWDWKENN